MGNNDTFFSNDTSGSSDNTSFLQATQSDVTVPANSNSGFTDNASTNPLGAQFGNDNSVKYAAKTLYIKDYLLIQDRSKWIGGKETYQIIWHESYPAVNGYLFGNVQLNYKQSQPHINVKSPGDGMAVNGIIRRVSWLVNACQETTGTAQLLLDGANTNTISFGDLAPNVDNIANLPRYLAIQAETSNETKDLHEFRITANQSNTLKIIGVIVYFENAGQNIDVFPGTTYVNKAQIITGAVTPLALPTFGSSLGGRALIYMNGTAPAISALSATTMTSIAVGTIATNLLNLTSGTGASFPVGSGVVLSQGTSNYVGVVQQVSTDTLTVYPTLGFGASNAIYRSFLSGLTFNTINASFMELSRTIDFSQMNGFSNVPFLDPLGQFSFSPSAMGTTFVATNATLTNGVQAGFFTTNTGAFQLDGYFSAAEIEYVNSTQSILHVTVSIDGLPAWSENQGITGAFKQTLFTDGGPGWHSVLFQPGQSINITGDLGIARVNMYRRAKDPSIVFGNLAVQDTLQANTYRGAINCTIMSLGTYRRVYSDQLYLADAWTRIQGSTSAGGVQYNGNGASSAIIFNYYGKDVGLVGTAPGGATLTIDGVGVPLTFNVMNSVSTESWHQLILNTVSSGTCSIQAIDYTRSHSEIGSIQNYTGVTTPIQPLNTILYAQTANQTIPDSSTTLLNQFSKKYVDSYNLVSVGAGWKYVSRETGIFRISGSVSFTNSANWSTSNQYKLLIYRNGAEYFSLFNGQINVAITSGNGTLVMKGSLDLPLYTGDVIQFYVFQNSGSNQVTGADSDGSYLSITKLGALTR